jgi:hypothetical protein
VTNRVLFEPESLSAYFDRFRRDHPGIPVTPPDGAGLWVVTLPDKTELAYDTGARCRADLKRRFPDSV